MTVKSLSEQFIPFGVLTSEPAGDDNLLFDLAYTYISLKISKGLLPAEDGSRVVFPHALAGLFVYEAVKLQIDEILKSISNDADIELFNKRMKEIQQEIRYCEKMKNEADRMKQGSIALVGQIVTISKIRIYDPKYSKDALSKVRISAATLDILDAKVQELYGAPPKKQ